jgi:hypothetical protein
MIELIVNGLATWRISNMLVEEEGPYDIFERLRHRLGVQYLEDGAAYSHNEWGKLFTCVWCMSVWVGAIVFIVSTLTGVAWFGIPFALSALAIIINEAVSWLAHQNTPS